MKAYHITCAVKRGLEMKTVVDPDKDDVQHIVSESKISSVSFQDSGSPASVDSIFMGFQYCKSYFWTHRHLVL